MKSLFVIGDSISLDYGPHLEAALPEGIHYSRKSGEEEAYENLDIPRGANGGDSGMVLSFLQALDDSGMFEADLLLINCGLHDIKRDRETGELQVHPKRYRRNLEAIVGVAERLADRVAWVATTPVHDELHAKRGCGFDRVQADVEQYNEIAATVMAMHHIPVLRLDTFTRELGHEMELYRDGVHFLKPVQARQGGFLAEEAVRLLA